LIQTRFTYGDRETYRLFLNTFFIVGAVTLLSAAVAIFFAWVVTRTDTPYRGVITLFMIVPFFIPSILEVFAWANPNGSKFFVVCCCNSASLSDPFTS
jgi:ABC-type Fe3+ transport system permease subunit